APAHAQNQRPVPADERSECLAVPLGGKCVQQLVVAALGNAEAAQVRQNGSGGHGGGPPPGLFRIIPAGRQVGLISRQCCFERDSWEASLLLPVWPWSSRFSGTASRR